MDKSKLVKLGLTEAESIIYTSVLKLGTCTVKQISKDSGFHRTNIYDILEQLKEKGLISYHKEGKSTFYTAQDPKNLYNFLEEKKNLLDNILPDLEKLQKQSSEEIQVEVLKGESGMKIALKDMLSPKALISAFGVKGQLREKLPTFSEQFIRDMNKNKIQYYGIYTKRHFNPPYFTKIKYVSEELSGPVATFIYKDRVQIGIWEPSLVAIIIKSKIVAKAYKQHFDLLWKIAKA